MLGIYIYIYINLVETIKFYYYEQKKKMIITSRPNFRFKVKIKVISQLNAVSQKNHTQNYIVICCYVHIIGIILYNQIVFKEQDSKRSR